MLRRTRGFSGCASGSQNQPENIELPSSRSYRGDALCTRGGRAFHDSLTAKQRMKSDKSATTTETVAAIDFLRRQSESRPSPVYTTSSRLISRQWPIGSFYFGRESQKDREMEACTCTWGEVAGKTRERFGNRGRKRLTTRGSVPNQRSYVVIPRRG